MRRIIKHSRASIMTVGVIVAVLSAGFTSYALSIAPQEPWSPTTITAHGDLHYTGNALILDATSGEPTLSVADYPFNSSRADLRLTRAETNSIHSAYLVWGVSATDQRTLSLEGLDTLLFRTPNSSVIPVEAVDTYTTSSEIPTAYFISDITHLPIQTGIYEASLPILSSSNTTYVAAGWSLYVVTNNEASPLRSFAPYWNSPLNFEQTIAQEQDLIFGLAPGATTPTLIELPDGQSREPASGYTRINDVVLGESDTADMFLGPAGLESNIPFPAPAFGYNVTEHKANTLSGHITLLDSNTRTPVSEIRSGQRLTAQVQIENRSDADLFDAEVRVKLPKYLKFKRGSLLSPAGTINSGNFTDRDDEDPARYSAEDSLVIWKPGDTAVSNTSRPYLVKREDSPQLLEFEVYVGDLPIASVLRLQGVVTSRTSGNTEILAVSVTVPEAPVITGYSSTAKTDLAVKADLLPLSPTYWELRIFISNHSSLISAYTWASEIPAEGVVIMPELSDVNCEISTGDNSNLLMCKSNYGVSPDALVVDSVVLRIDRDPTELTWSTVDIKPTNSVQQDIDALNNSRDITIHNFAYYAEPVAYKDVFYSLTNASYVSDVGVLSNDSYMAGRTEVEMVSPPIHGTVRLNPETGEFSYQQRTRALITQDSFTYRLRDKYSGALSGPAQALIIFPEMKESAR